MNCLNWYKSLKWIDNQQKLNIYWVRVWRINKSNTYIFVHNNCNFIHKWTLSPNFTPATKLSSPPESSHSSQVLIPLIQLSSLPKPTNGWKLLMLRNEPESVLPTLLNPNSAKSFTSNYPLSEKTLKAVIQPWLLKASRWLPIFTVQFRVK